MLVVTLPVKHTIPVNLSVTFDSLATTRSWLDALGPPKEMHARVHSSCRRRPPREGVRHPQRSPQLANGPENSRAQSNGMQPGSNGE